MEHDGDGAARAGCDCHADETVDGQPRLGLERRGHVDAATNEPRARRIAHGALEVPAHTDQRGRGRVLGEHAEARREVGRRSASDLAGLEPGPVVRVDVEAQAIDERRRRRQVRRRLDRHQADRHVGVDHDPRLTAWRRRRTGTRARGGHHERENENENDDEQR